MQLITTELEETIPMLYATEDIKLEDKRVYAKLFTPDTDWTWYIMELSIEERICFAMTQNDSCMEIGYTSIDELESIKGPLGLGVERDLGFTACKYSELKL